MGVVNEECTTTTATTIVDQTGDEMNLAVNYCTDHKKDSILDNVVAPFNASSKMEISSVSVSGEGRGRSSSPSGVLALNLKTVTVSGSGLSSERSRSPSPFNESQPSPRYSNSHGNSRLLKSPATSTDTLLVSKNNEQNEIATSLGTNCREIVMKSPPVPIHPKRRHLNNLVHNHHHNEYIMGQSNRKVVRGEDYRHHHHDEEPDVDEMDAPSSEIDESEVALDLSCHSRGNRGGSDKVRDLSSHHHRQLSSSSSKSSSSSSLCDSISPMAMLAAARSAAAAGIPPYIFDHRDSYERDSSSPQDSDDSDGQPMDLGINPKAYKKSLMKRYRKFTSPL